MPDSIVHGLTLCSDFLGFDYAECECGWVGPPCPGTDLAAETYAEHIAAS